MASTCLKVFINFRGLDTRFTFLTHVCAGLKSKNGIISVEIDENFKRGEYIVSEIKRAIKESAMCIAIISEDYAGSDAPLDELGMILKRQETEGKAYMVLPIYYRTKMEDVKRLTGSFATSLANMEEEFGQQQCQEWKRALTKVTELQGLEVLPEEDESMLCDTIVADVMEQVNWLKSEGIIPDKSPGIEAPAEYSKKARDDSLPSDLSLALSNSNSSSITASSSEHRSRRTSIVNAFLELKAFCHQNIKSASQNMEMDLAFQRSDQQSEIRFRKSFEECQAKEKNLRERKGKMEGLEAELADVDARIEERRQRQSSLAVLLLSHAAILREKSNHFELQKVEVKELEQGACQILEEAKKVINSLFSKFENRDKQKSTE